MIQAHPMRVHKTVKYVLANELMLLASWGGTTKNLVTPLLTEYYRRRPEVP